MLDRLIEGLGRPVDPRPLALARIGIGVAGGAIGLETWRLMVKVSADGKLQVPGIEWLPGPSEAAAAALLIVWTILATGLTVGLLARAAAAGLALLGVFAMLADQQLYSNHLSLFIVLAALLCLGPCSAAWSLDAGLRGRVAETVPHWPVFLLKFQTATVYAFAGLAKLNGDFLSGDVLEFVGREPLPGLGEPVLVAAAIGTICVELFLAVGLWAPKLQRVAIPLGIGFHLAIIVGIENALPLIPFALLMYSNYALFLPPGQASRLMDRLETLAPVRLKPA
jgi:hypothetical protein